MSNELTDRWIVVYDDNSCMTTTEQSVALSALMAGEAVYRGVRQQLVGEPTMEDVGTPLVWPPRS